AQLESLERIRAAAFATGAGELARIAVELFQPERGEQRPTAPDGARGAVVADGLEGQAGHGDPGGADGAHHPDPVLDLGLASLAAVDDGVLARAAVERNELDAVLLDERADADELVGQVGIGRDGGWRGDADAFDTDSFQEVEVR